MSYRTQANIAADRDVQDRVAQAAAEENAPDDADQWMIENRRIWASAPGWDDAWESAIVSNPDPAYRPGNDEAVITDAMILSQVQAMLAAP